MTTDCFRTQNSVLINVTDTGDTPCGSTSSGFSPCCRRGDECLEDRICHFTRGGTGTSGYYIASCTDESGTDPSCLQTCSSNAEPDIVYIEADTLWHCCQTDADTGATDCSTPTNYTFQAPAPDKLAIFASSSTSTLASPGASSSSASVSPSLQPSSATQSSSITNNVSSKPTSSSTPKPTSGLSAGAKAGIGVGVALGVVCIVLLSIIIILMRKRQRRQQDTGLSSDEHKGPQEEGKDGKGIIKTQQSPRSQLGRHELQGQTINSELDPSRGAFHEMEVER